MTNWNCYYCTCNDCRWAIQRKECPWNYDYEGTDYAEDCIDFRNINYPESEFKEET